MKNRLREARKKLALTQKEVARLLDIGNTTYNRYENGLIEPSCSKLRKLAELFGTSIDYLLKHDKTQEWEIKARVLTAELNEKYSALDQRGKEAVNATVIREYNAIQEEGEELYS